jgi:DNA polymerase sigma
LVLGLSIDSDIPVIKLVCFHLALELDLAVHTFLTMRNGKVSLGWIKNNFDSRGNQLISRTEVICPK